MIKYVALATVGALSIATSLTPAVAQSRVPPMGDTVEMTPTVDLTPGQIRRARPRDRALLEGRSAYVPMPPHRPAHFVGEQFRR
jgi:hypothetical protein